MVLPCKQKASGKTSKQALLAKANGKKTVGQPKTTVDESILHLIIAFKRYINSRWILGEIAWDFTPAK